MVSKAVESLKSFIERQKTSFHVFIVRGILANFQWGLTQNYTSIYTVKLGADPVQLGSLGSVGNVITAFLSAPMGWLADRYSLKKLFLLGLILEALVSLTYALSQDWYMLVIPVILFSVTMVTTWMIEGILLANSLRDEDRATGFGMYSTVGQIPALIAPLLAGFIVTQLGGIAVESIRPLFYMNFFISILMIIWIHLRLEDVKAQSSVFKGSFLASFREMFTAKKGMKRWLFIELLGSFTFGSTMPFIMVYAAEVKHVDAITLGFMGSAMTLVSMLSSIPLGKIADRIGRKKTIILFRPLLYLSFILLVWAPRFEFLIIAFALRGILWSSFNVWMTMQLEMVPADKRGRWRGIINMFRSIVRIPAPIVGGLLWTYVDPSVPFLLVILMDAAIRMPLLWKIPETLAVSERKTGF